MRLVLPILHAIAHRRRRLAELQSQGARGAARVPAPDPAVARRAHLRGGGAFAFAHGFNIHFNLIDPRPDLDVSAIAREEGGGGHRAAAGCNDCHTPPGLVAKYTTKAVNGFWHSFAFTTGRFHEPITIGPRNRAVTEAACRHCHGEVVASIETHRGQGAIACARCHDSVGHLH